MFSITTFNVTVQVFTMNSSHMFISILTSIHLFQPWQRSTFLAFFFLIAIAFFAPFQVDARVVPATPRTRGGYCHEEIGPDVPVPQGYKLGATDHCPHCLNGGGVGQVRENLKSNYRPYESDNRPHAGPCGDSIGKNDHMVGALFVADVLGYCQFV